MRALIIGTGAAGNKAVVNLMELGVVDKDDVLLINSTLKDVPEKYRNIAVKLSDEYDGCGKERSLSKEITDEAIKDGTLNFNNLPYDIYKVIIVTSMEGGTGSGSTDIIAKHLYEKQNINNIEIFAFKGFEEDVRGIQNSIEFFQDMKPTYGVQVINNAAFLKEAGGNIKKAHKLANDELARIIRVYLGQVLVAGEDNVDGSDLYKVTNTTGYSTIEYTTIEDKIKSTEEFNKIISEMIDSTKSLSLSPSATLIAVIINLQESSQDNIDYSFSVIREKLGEPYEIFKHIQYDKKSEEFIAIISSGMKMPIDELRNLKDKYDKRRSLINKSDDEFYTEALSMQGNSEDNRFNMMSSVRKNRRQQQATNKFKNTNYRPQSDY